MSIGKNVLGKPTPIEVPAVNIDYGITDSKTRKIVLDFLMKSDKPHSIKEVARALNLNWNTAKHALVELLLSGRVEHWRSGRNSVFRVKPLHKEVQTK